jgi:hypothetical protein
LESAISRIDAERGTSQSEKMAEEEWKLPPHSVIGILKMAGKHPNRTA